MVRRLSILLALIVLLAACSQAPATPPAPTAQPAGEAPANGSSPAPITVEHFGGTLTLDQPATRVVACSEEALDFLVALGVQAVGFCSDRSEGAVSGQSYELPHFFPKERLGSPLFVGSAATPSAELIATLKPDLIIAADYTEGNEQLAQIAPTFVLSVDVPGYWRETLQDIGRLVGRAAEAEAFLEEYDLTVERLVAQTAPIAKEAPNLLLVYSFGASEGTMLLGNAWSGSRPFTQLGFTVLEPEGVSFVNGIAPISDETVAQAEADIIFVLRPELPDGSRPGYPLDDLLAARDDARVVYQVFPSTRGSTAPYTDRFVLEEVAGLLSAPAAAAPGGASAGTRIDSAIFTREPSVNVVASDGATRTVAHTRGETAIPAAPQRIVVLDETLADSLLALDVTPVGSATYYGIEGFSAHIAPFLSPEASIGQYGSPSLERIVALRPDLILSDGYTAEELYDELSAIAPTVVYTDEYTYPLLRAVARTVGREDAAEARIAAYEAKAAEARATLQGAMAGKQVALLRVFGSELRVEGGIGYTGPVLWQALGLTPHRLVNLEKWNEKYSLELIPQLDADVLLLMPEIDGADTARAMQASPLWQQLPAVQSGSVYTLEGYSHWLTYGILANERAIDDILATLAPEGAGR